MKAQTEILVFAQWAGMPHAQPMGTLSATTLRGKEVFSFEYQTDWLKAQQGAVLDPDLQLYSGPQYQQDAERANFGLFLDSSPDRWGRLLMRRREAALARKEERPQRTLKEMDYLLGVFDGQRMGGLRFKTAQEGPFLNDSVALATPPWANLRTLEEISLKLEEEEVMDDPEYLNWLNMLVAPGSSIGGARPKAGVLDEKGHLWIAKFPSKQDEGDTGAWEMVTHELALQAGIHMAPAKAMVFSGKYHTFLTKRFDRNAQNQRLHFASAMTMLGYHDGQDFHDGVSYVELAEFLIQHGANTTQDLQQLWRRIVFSICVKNTDDHLRNHGFIMTPQGWVLSPAYDLNPVETGTGLKLNISLDENALDLDLAKSVASYFRLKPKAAQSIINEVLGVVKQWPKLAKKYHISRLEQELKAPAFMANT